MYVKMEIKIIWMKWLNVIFLFETKQRVESKRNEILTGSVQCPISILFFFCWNGNGIERFRDECRWFGIQTSGHYKFFVLLSIFDFVNVHFWSNAVDIDGECSPFVAWNDKNQWGVVLKSGNHIRFIHLTWWMSCHDCTVLRCYQN